MKPHLALLLGTFIYGLFYVAIKILVTAMTPLETFTLRLLLAIPLFMLIEGCFLKTRIASWGDAVKIALLGLLGITLVQLTAVVGVKYTAVFHAGFIVGTAPLLTLILSVLLGQERLTMPKIGGTVIAFAGLCLLLMERPTNNILPTTYLWGDLLMLINISGWALFIILSRPMLERYPPFSLTAYAFLFAGVLTLPVIFCGGFQSTMPGVGLNLEGWLWMGFVVVFSTILTYFLNYYALSRLVPSSVAIYVFLQPLVTALFAHWILNEPITPMMMLDGCVILVGVALATESYRVLLPREPSL